MSCCLRQLHWAAVVDIKPPCEIKRPPLGLGSAANGWPSRFHRPFNDVIAIQLRLLYDSLFRDALRGSMPSASLASYLSGGVRIQCYRAENEGAAVRRYTWQVEAAQGILGRLFVDRIAPAGPTTNRGGTTPENWVQRKTRKTTKISSYPPHIKLRRKICIDLAYLGRGLPAGRRNFFELSKNLTRKPGRPTVWSSGRPELFHPRGSMVPTLALWVCFQSDKTYF